MPQSLKTGLVKDFPVNIVNTPGQDVLVGNGLNKWQRWDGIRSATEDAGMRKPDSLVVSSVSGVGGSLSEQNYVCGVRWVDDAGIAGDMRTEVVTWVSGDTAIQWFLDGYVNAYGTPSRAATLQLWRSLPGETAVLYPLFSYNVGSIPSDVVEYYTDDELTGQDGASMGVGYLANIAPITIVNADASVPAFGLSKGEPPIHMSVMVHHKNRMYAAVPVDYSIGMVELTNGSAAVAGVGTDWETDNPFATLYHSGPQQLRIFSVPGDTLDYGWAASDADTGAVSAHGTQIAFSTYQGSSSNFAQYTTRLPATEYLKVCYTYIGETVDYESWPATYTFQCHAPGGRITALIASGTDMYIAKQAKLYSFVVQDDPQIDGAIRLAENHRGCENQRTWCETDRGAAVMDRQGIYLWAGSTATDISEPIQDYFRDGKINWTQSRWFSAKFDQESATVMFFVCLASSTKPKTALCFNFNTRSWTIYEWDFGIGAAAVARVANRRRVILGCEHAKMRVMDASLDGISADTTGTLRGSPTGASLCRLEDSTASFSSDVVGTVVAIVDGKGKGQSRRIVATDGTSLTLLHPWTNIPDTTSVYQIGGFSWELVTTSFRYTQRAPDTTREFTLNYKPTSEDCHLFVERIHNFNGEGTPWSSGADTGDTMRRLGVTVRGNDSDAKLDLKKKRHPLSTQSTNTYDDPGFARLQYDGNSDVKGQADRNVALRLHGHQGPSTVEIYRLVIDGVRV